MLNRLAIIYDLKIDAIVIMVSGDEENFRRPFKQRESVTLTVTVSIT